MAARKPTPNKPRFTVPGLELTTAQEIADDLDVRLASLVDLAMTIDHRLERAGRGQEGPQKS